MRTSPLVLAAAALVAAGAVAVAVVRHRAVEPPPPPVAAVTTVALERRDLSTSRQLNGSLGFGTSRSLSGHSSATVTWLPAPGATVSRGGQLFRADDRPVTLFYGGMPMYRAVAGEGLVGRDVRIVADNLVALGYSIGHQPRAGTVVQSPASASDSAGGSDSGGSAGSGGGSGGSAGSAGSAGGSGGSGGAAGSDSAAGSGGAGGSGGASGSGGAAGSGGVGDSASAGAGGSGSGGGSGAGKTIATTVRSGDGVLTKGLIAAVKRWQTAVGVPATGAIAVGDVEVASGALRVDSVAAQPGVSADGVLMAVTPTRKVITVDAELADAASIRRGQPVNVELPDDRTVKAQVLSVGRSLATPDGGAGSGPPKLTVTVTLDDPKTVAKLDAADVTVDFPGQTVKDVLAAPIEALVALSEGGYAVQTAAGLTAVQTGMFADGWVEITADNLDADTPVVVAS